jgi:hypothetical protein
VILFGQFLKSIGLMVPFEQALSSLVIVMQIAIGEVGFYIQFEQQEIQEKHLVPQKV